MLWLNYEVNIWTMMQLNLMNIILVYPPTSFIYIYIYYNHFLEHILNLNYKTLSKKVEAKELGPFTAILC